MSNPTCIWSDGTKKWFQDDILHRDEGPAVEYSNGDKSFYLNGKKLTEKAFNKIQKGKGL